MAKIISSYQNFVGGELSPKMRGRIDTEIFYKGAERIENFIPYVQGSLNFRTGTKYVHQTRRNKIANLIPFNFNDEQAYLLEFTEEYIRVFKDDGILVEPSKTITDATQANPVVITSASHGYSNGDEIFINNVGGMEEVNGKFYLANNVTANTYELQNLDSVNIDGTGFTAYTSGGISQRIVEVASPYQEEDLFDLDYAQNADVMYIVGLNYEPRKFTRTGATTFTLSTYTRTSDPFTGANNYPATITFYEARLWYGGTNNKPQKVWGSRAADYENHTTGTGDDDALEYTLLSKEVCFVKWMIGLQDFLAIGTTSAEYKVDGGSTSEAITPSNINARTIRSYGSANVRPIRKNELLLFMQKDSRTLRDFEYKFESDTYDANNLMKVADHITEGGVKQIAYQDANPSIIWFVKNNGKLIGLTLDKTEKVFAWHRHYTGANKEDDFISCGVLTQKNGYDQIWFVIKRIIDGVTRYYVEYLTDNIVIPEKIDYSTDLYFRNAMWEKQLEYIHVDCSLSYNGADVGLAASSNLTPSAVTGQDINFTSSTSIFSIDDVGREILKKAINGIGIGRARITEYVSPTQVKCLILKDFDNTDTMLAGNWYLTAIEISGLEYLEGKEVTIIANGGKHPIKTVTDGAITLDGQFSVVHIGLGYTGFFKSMNLANPQYPGGMQTRLKSVNEIGIKFLETLGGEYGTNLNNMEKILYRTILDLLDRPPVLFTGSKLIAFPDDAENDKFLYFKQTNPLPLILQHLMLTINVE